MRRSLHLRLAHQLLVSYLVLLLTFLPNSCLAFAILVFRDECKDPSLNDCPPTSVCVDQFYGFVCQCKPGFVDKSPNIQDNPGRVCVQDGAAGTNGTIAPEAIPEEPPTPPSVSGTPRGTSPKVGPKHALLYSVQASAGSDFS